MLGRAGTEDSTEQSDQTGIARRSTGSPGTGSQEAAAVSTMQLLLPTVMTSPGEARRACRAFARRNHVQAIDTLLLVLSELVTNAVQHGGAPIGIRIDCEGGSVRIEVSDATGNPAEVTPRRDISLDGTGGMGLRIIDAVSLGWGAHENQGGCGKTVWAEIPGDETKP
jgi:anti-sigma regulatory factor (Ser/Thr protein kinase)